MTVSQLGALKSLPPIAASKTSGSMRSPTHVLFFVWALAASPLTCAADASTDYCVNVLNQQTAATVGRDFEALEKFARRYLARCSNLDAEITAGSYESLAEALLEQKKYRDALKTAEMCLDLSFESAGCHLAKAQVLWATGKQAQARATLDVAERLIEEQLPRLRGEVPKARSSLDKDLAASRVNKVTGIRTLASALRREYGN